MKPPECEKVSLRHPDPATGLRYGWEVVLSDGRRIPWRGFYTGPLTLGSEEIESLCRELLQIESSALGEAAKDELEPVSDRAGAGPSLIIHSNTPDLKAFDGDLEDVLRGREPADHTTYTETRSVYMAGPRDLALGRTSTWRTAVDLHSLEAVEIPGIDYYYFSHALLLLARRHLRSPSVQIERIVERLRTQPNTVIRLYALEREMQIFLIWLRRLAGLKKLRIDANSPEVAEAWNRKSAFYPTVRDALGQTEALRGLSTGKKLETESRNSPVRRDLGVRFPALPGYTIQRSGEDRSSFIRQALEAAKMLQSRYGLRRGCLKASEAGNGARISPGIDLGAQAALVSLAESAYPHGDDYVLEAHVDYLKVEAGEGLVNAAPSAHIRWGQVAEGITLQFTEGTSWRGNLYLDADTCESFGISATHYRSIQRSMSEFRRAFRDRKLGLTIGGIDFAVGRIGGVFEDELLLAAQDPNISFTGAESLRVFMKKTRERHSLGEGQRLYGVSRVIRPGFACPLPALRTLTESATAGGSFVDAIASIPGRWGMVAAADQDPARAIAKIDSLCRSLAEKGLFSSSA